ALRERRLALSQEARDRVPTARRDQASGNAEPQRGQQAVREEPKGVPDQPEQGTNGERGEDGSEAVEAGQDVLLEERDDRGDDRGERRRGREPRANIRRDRGDLLRERETEQERNEQND